MTGITYFITDKNGVTHTRYSARELTPQYVSALIKHRSNAAQPDKGDISYSRKAQIAPLPYYYQNGWKGEQVRVECEVVKVRAYEGRHKVEPKA